MKRKATVALAGLVVLLGVAGVAYAATNDQTDAAEPEISKQEAKTIAADHVGGTAESVALEQEDGPVYEVTVTQDDGPSKEVEVDGNRGEVLEVENADDGEVEVLDDLLGDD